jgi:formylglycine-generating enzyme required for sulfatase activity/DNA-binding winged helix-turn-helix (wHTH) protein
MDRIVPRLLLFDRFVLDLTRGCLRAGDQDLELRPKAFEVLCYLAENAGRLIPKQELHSAIWTDVTVSDDSIVQCIRELRIKLGDDDRRLIKTVSRRGYLLDAAVSPGGPRPLPDSSPAVPSRGAQAQVGRPQPLRTIRTVGLRAWLAIAACLLGAGGWWAIHQLGWPISAVSPSHLALAENAIGTVPAPVGFKSCADCPEMTVLAPGEFMMGSPASESGRYNVEPLARRVVIPNRIAIGKFEVTLDQFAGFVAQTGMAVSDLCRVIVAYDRTDPVWALIEASFRHPGFDVVGSQPAVCVSWYEAQAYVTWLARRTGKPYRLPTEAEWEYAARAGTKTRYSFGDDETMLCAHAKFADLGSGYGWRDACRSDRVAYGTLPVGSLRPNPWGLFDMHGNAWEWVQDCWTPDASKIPTDGSAFTRLDGCEEGVIRGGSFASGSRRVRSAIRASQLTAAHNYNTGFRVALSLGD